MQQFQTRDSVCKYILDNVRLNRYDNKFISNITAKYIIKNRPLTHKQSEVFDIIVAKYNKQLKKMGIDYKDILNLKWENGFYEAKDMQAQSYFKCLNNIMMLSFPFNKGKINIIRTFVYDDAGKHLNKSVMTINGPAFGENEKYNFTWNKENANWQGEFNLHLMLDLYNFALEYNIKIDDSIETIKTEYEQYGNKEVWETQLHIVNGSYYVNNISESMLNVIKEFDFQDLSMYNTENICLTLGIQPPSTVNKDRAKLMLCNIESNYVYKTYSVEKQQELYKYLKETSKATLFYLPGKNAVFFNTNNKHGPFILEAEMNDWDTNHIVYNYGEMSERLTLIESMKIDTIVSPLSMSDLLQSTPGLKDITLNIKKYIRII